MTATLTRPRCVLLDALQADGGFTYDPRTGRLIRVGTARGYAIAVPDTERVLGSSPITGEEFTAALAAVITDYGPLLDSGAFVGGWYSPERDTYLVEVSEVRTLTRATAVRLGAARGQESILDLATGEFISTGGRGDVAVSA